MTIAFALEQSTPFSSKSNRNPLASFSSSLFFRYCWLNHLPFSISNLAPDLLILSMEKLSINSSNVKSSCSVPGFQPSIAKKLVIASGRYPCPLNPMEISLVIGSSQSRGNTGYPCLSASRLLSFPFPSGLSNKGKCANWGIVSAHPKY